MLCRVFLHQDFVYKYIRATMMKKTIIITLLTLPILLFSTNNKNIPLRGYTGGSWNSQISSNPYFIGADYIWEYNNYLSISAGFTFFSGYGESKNWTANETKYSWNNNDDYMFTINLSSRLDLPLIKASKNHINLFIEPGIMLEPNTHTHIIKNAEGGAVEAYTTGPKTYFQSHFGISYSPSLETNIPVKYELSYFISNLDLYEQYRNIYIDNTNLEDFLPQHKLLQGLRLAMIVEF